MLMLRQMSKHHIQACSNAAHQELIKDASCAVGDGVCEQVNASSFMCIPTSPAAGFYEVAQVHERVPEAQLLSFIRTCERAKAYM